MLRKRAYYLQPYSGAEYEAVKHDLDKRIDAHRKTCEKCDLGPLDSFSR